MAIRLYRFTVLSFCLTIHHVNVPTGRPALILPQRFNGKAGDQHADYRKRQRHLEVNYLANS
jgi:hypothetical protein